MKSTSRTLFVAGIFAGSFLLFLIQPMVARLALPMLGGAPNVWNSAMLVYQALLLGGYAYAHAIRSWPVRRQIGVQLVLLMLAGLTLPISLVDIPSFGSGLEVLWVPAFILASIGPVFFLVSAQAPLVQRWYAVDPDAGDPYPLYAASNLGSFSGLLSYPLIIEPLLTLQMQALVWSAGYIVLILFVALFARSRWNYVTATGGVEQDLISKSVPAKTIVIWLMLAAVPSGMMLSTTTHLTTDIFAMPLLWVIPLGLYLLSFVPAFSENRRPAKLFSRIAPIILLLIGGMAMMTQSGGGLTLALASIVMLFVVSVVLHAKLFELRPPPQQLTLFYLIMSIGGVLGGLFTALFAPLMFDWVWEHPILVLAAAMLIPLGGLMPWQEHIASNPKLRLIFVPGVAAVATILAALLLIATPDANPAYVAALILTIVALALMVKFNRFAFVILLLLLMTARGIVGQVAAYSDGDRTRSYFGVYNVRDMEASKMRVLLHGTTMHGRQFQDPERATEPTAYYGRSSGVGLVLDNALDLYGPESSVGVIGLGVGTLACYRGEKQNYRFYEIDPEVPAYSDKGRFTFLSECAADSEIVIGDARIALEREPANQFDVLVVDAFSSDAIPLHLLTFEAMEVYQRSLTIDGALLIHISNRFLDLEPVLAAAAGKCGCNARVRIDRDGLSKGLTPSYWVLITRDDTAMENILAKTGPEQWSELEAPLDNVWSDDYASILPQIRWQNFMSFDK